MKRMNRLIATFVCALAMVMLTCIPAQAEFYGTLQQNQPWSLEVDNSSNASSAAVTIFYVGKTLDADKYTVPKLELVTLNVTKMPRGTTRVIIEVDPGNGNNYTDSMCVPLRLFQGGACGCCGIHRPRLRARSYSGRPISV